MFSIIRNTLTTQAERAAAHSEIYPDLYLDRIAERRKHNLIESVAMIGTIALAAFAVFLWLAYEGVITPNMFN